MRKLADYIRDLPKEPFELRDEPTVRTPKVLYYPDNPEEVARSETRLKAEAGQPELKPDGTRLYHCKLCKDMHYLRADVPVGHKLFGRVRPCPCHPEYATRGATWQ